MTCGCRSSKRSEVLVVIPALPSKKCRYDQHRTPDANSGLTPEEQRKQFQASSPPPTTSPRLSSAVSPALSMQSVTGKQGHRPLLLLAQRWPRFLPTCSRNPHFFLSPSNPVYPASPCRLRNPLAVRHRSFASESTNTDHEHIRRRAQSVLLGCFTSWDTEALFFFSRPHAFQHGQGATVYQPRCFLVVTRGTSRKLIVKAEFCDFCSVR